MAEKKLSEFKAIATAYRAYQFRSRLEAKYACLFDLLGWRWSYEPFDLNGWIPDFAIGEHPTLVEVKPFFNESEWDEAKAKIRDSGCTRPVILLGADATWWATGDNEAPQIGWLYDPQQLNGRTEWQTADLHFGLTEGRPRDYGLCPMYGGWFNYVWNLASKEARVWLAPSEREDHLVSLWADASNVSQWIPTGERIDIRERGA